MGNQVSTHSVNVLSALESTQNSVSTTTTKTVQEEVEGRNVSKVRIFFSGESPIDIYRPLDGDTRGDFGSHSEEVVVHAGMDNFHRSLVAGVAITATHASSILTVNRDKKS